MITCERVAMREKAWEGEISLAFDSESEFLGTLDFSCRHSMYGQIRIRSGVDAICIGNTTARARSQKEHFSSFPPHAFRRLSPAYPLTRNAQFRRCMHLLSTMKFRGEMSAQNRSHE